VVSMGPVTITCPLCKAPQTVPTTVVSQDEYAKVVVVSMDAAPLRHHMEQCDGRPPVAPPAPVAETSSAVELAHKARPVPAFIAPGTRACIGCGQPAEVCLRNLSKGRKGGPSATGRYVADACCGMCQDGNTHPSPGAQVDCQVWAAEHGAPTADADGPQD